MTDPTRPLPRHLPAQYLPPPYIGPYPPGHGYLPGPIQVPVASPKSRAAAGLLQAVPGMFGVGGVGRLYAGHIGLGMAQIVISVVGWTLAVCLFWLVVPVAIPIALAVWFVVDGVLLATQASDGYGREMTS